MIEFILGFIFIILFGVSLWIKAISWILIGFIIVGVPVCIYLFKPYNGKHKYK